MVDYCQVCGRHRFHENHLNRNICAERVKSGKVYYHHDYYGCDTGCCGHSIVIEDANGTVIKSIFEFSHIKDDLDYKVGEISERLKIEIAECQFVDYC